jgi:hypothetical protein
MRTRRSSNGSRARLITSTISKTKTAKLACAVPDMLSLFVSDLKCLQPDEVG